MIWMGAEAAVCALGCETQWHQPWETLNVYVIPFAGLWVSLSDRKIVILMIFTRVNIVSSFFLQWKPLFFMWACKSVQRVGVIMVFS